MDDAFADELDVGCASVVGHAVAALMLLALGIGVTVAARRRKA